MSLFRLDSIIVITKLFKTKIMTFRNSNLSCKIFTMYFIKQKFRHRKMVLKLVSFVSLLLAFTACGEVQQPKPKRNTKVSIVEEQFHINGEPIYKGRTWTTSDGKKFSLEGLLMNARLVQGIFDDLNPRTRGQWIYPDTRQWDPGRNNQEFINAMATWREHGLLGFTLNLQGGCPYGYCRHQPWDNSAFSSDGSLRQDYMHRLEGILDQADELGMVIILTYFYFGQDGNLVDEEAVKKAVKNATEWILNKGYTNVIIEINNECNVAYGDHDILQCDRVHELINLAKDIELSGQSLYVSTSLGGGSVPPENIVKASDFVLLHGNGVRNPGRMVEMIEEVKDMDVYTPMPIVNNEDDQPWRVDEQGWGEADNNFVECVKNYGSWGYFDFRRAQERYDYNQGYQSVPVNWQISSERKRNFFDLLAEITGFPGTPTIQLDWGAEIGEGSVRIEDKPTGITMQRLEILVNNQVQTTVSEKPFDFYLKDLPKGEHWIKARATYHNKEHEVIVESPYYQNPWWPYGGPG